MRSRLDMVDDWERRAQDAGYSASKMARTLGVTSRLLQTFFQQRFGVSPREWMLRARMKRAALLLAKANSVKVVAAETGYKQVSHFSREFKRFFGVPPGTFTFGEINPAEIWTSASADSHLDNELRL